MSEYGDVAGAVRKARVMAETDIWIVLIEDRHADVDARPFSSKETAIYYARKQAAANAAHPENIKEITITPGMARDGWVFCVEYSSESDCVRVIKRTLDDDDEETQ